MERDREREWQRDGEREWECGERAGVLVGAGGGRGVEGEGEE